jgi:hypothetical protein
VASTFFFTEELQIRLINEILIHALLRQLLRFIRKGHQQFSGIDPKIEYKKKAHN